MTKRLPIDVASSTRVLLSRRTLVTSTGVGAFSLVLGRSVVGNSEVADYHSDNSDEGKKDRFDGDVRPAGTVPPGSAEVLIDDDDADGFQPGTITIDVGGSVTWVNIDKDPHTATSANFDTDTIEPGEQATVTFAKPGVFNYACSFHPMMTGIVEVRDEFGNVPTSPAATPQASPGASPQASSAADQQATVSILTLEFDPVELQVSIGTTVVWTNTKAVPHTVTSVDDVFDSGRLEVNDSFSHQFTTAGTFDYFCTIHPGMKATIIVTA